jgi:hypothetical protein
LDPINPTKGFEILEEDEGFNLDNQLFELDLPGTLSLPRLMSGTLCLLIKIYFPQVIKDKLINN